MKSVCVFLLLAFAVTFTVSQEQIELDEAVNMISEVQARALQAISNINAAITGQFLNLATETEQLGGEVIQVLRTEGEQQGVVIPEDDDEDDGGFFNSIFPLFWMFGLF